MCVCVMGRGLRQTDLDRLVRWEMGSGVHTGRTREGEIWGWCGGVDLALCSLILAGLEAWSAKKGLTVAL